MDTLGPYLRSAREAKGMDLRDAAQQTRISINYLKAIEEEDFSKLPGEVFVKGFLKSYARFLQLNEGEVMARYAGMAKPAAAAAAAPGQKSENQKAPAEQQQAAPEPERKVKRSWEPYLWSGIAVIALVAFLLIVLPERHHAVKEPSVPAASGPTSTTSMATALSATTAPEKLYLEIIALEDVWVLVRTDSSPQKKAALKKGESITWSADTRFLVSYGSIGAARLVLNGKELTVTGPKNAVVRDLIITAAGVAFQKFEAEKPKPQPKPRPVTKPVPTALPQAPMPSAPAPAPAPQPETKPAPYAPSPIESILRPQQ